MRGRETAGSPHLPTADIAAVVGVRTDNSNAERTACQRQISRVDRRAARPDHPLTLTINMCRACT